MNSWLVFLLPVFVSAVVMLVGGVVYLTSQSGSPKTSRAGSARADALPFKGANSSSGFDFPKQLDSTGPLGSSGPRRPRDALESHSQKPHRQPVEEIRQRPREEVVDWELEIADSEEVEPTHEMVEEARQRIREGRPSFGLVGTPGVRVAEIFQKRLAERRAESRAQNSGEAVNSSERDTEIRPENAATEAGAAGAGTW